MSKKDGKKKMRIVIFDDTDQNEIHEKAFVQIVGNNPMQVQIKSNEKQVYFDAWITPDEPTHIFFYPKGIAPGLAATVVYKSDWVSMAAKWNFDISISDDHIEFYGLPMKQAGGKISIHHTRE